MGTPARRRRVLLAAILTCAAAASHAAAQNRSRWAQAIAKSLPRAASGPAAAPARGLEAFLSAPHGQSERPVAARLGWRWG